MKFSESSPYKTKFDSYYKLIFGIFIENILEFCRQIFLWPKSEFLNQNQLKVHIHLNTILKVPCKNINKYKSYLDSSGGWSWLTQKCKPRLYGKFCPFLSYKLQRICYSMEQIKNFGFIQKY